jgi:hypothetical protein
MNENQENSIDLYFEDNKHSSVAGSYLNACVFYSAISGKTPEGTAYNPAELPANDLLKIQKVAYETAK